MAAFIELTAVPFHMPLKSISGSGESGVPAEPTELAEPADPDCPPPPLEHDHPPRARTKASVIIRRIDLTSGVLRAAGAIRIGGRAAALPRPDVGYIQAPAAPWG